MQTGMLKLADVLLFWAHAVVALYCVFGWLIPGGEVIHLVLIVLIGLSWYGLGQHYGIGYCILTDWQWRVRKRLGCTPEHGSFVQLLLERASGLHLNPRQVKWFAYLAYWLSACASISKTSLTLAPEVRCSSVTTEARTASKLLTGRAGSISTAPKKRVGFPGTELELTWPAFEEAVFEVTASEPVWPATGA